MKDCSYSNEKGLDLLKPLTRAEAATMILRALDYGEFNWENAVNILTERGIITENDASTMDFFTRGDMAKLIYESRKHGMF